MAIVASSVPSSAWKRIGMPDGRSSWRRLRDFISPVLQLRISRAIRRGEPVVLGSHNRPFETLEERHSLLDMLPEDRGLVVRIRCRGREILDDLPRLARLDSLHDLSVEWLIDRPRRLGWCRSSLEAAGRLAAEGIRVRLIWRAADGHNEPDLEDWVAEARRLRIWDVECRTERPSLSERFDVLRLEHGFPLFVPGRG